MPATRRALIAGLGLIGGSIGLALRERGWRVAYLDPHVDDPGHAADERAESLDDDADIVILATPADVAVELVRGFEVSRFRGAGAEPLETSKPRNLVTPVVTSTCSVMTPLRDAAGDRLFVAGHPLAGSERSGLGAARADLFRDKPWFVDRDHALVAELVAACGARLERVEAEEHDHAVALTSHLPQLLSTALAAHLADAGVDLRFAGGGLRTFLRLAASEAGVWRPVLEMNDRNIAPHLGEVVRIALEILAGDEAAFARAQELMKRLGQ